MKRLRTILTPTTPMASWIVAALLAAFLATPAMGLEPSRVWVDSKGRFSVEARLIELDADRVVLLRDNGQRVSVAIDRLSEADRDYLAERKSSRRPIAKASTESRPIPPQKKTDFKPLPELDLPAAKSVVSNGTVLSWQGPTRTKSPERLVSPLIPDPAPITVDVRAARVRLYNVDNNDYCSQPFPILVKPSAAQEPRTVIGISISSNVWLPGQRGANQLIRFDVENQKAVGVFDYPAKLRLIDHHLSTGRSLVHVGFDSLGKGGELAIGRGWEGRFRLSHMRKLASAEQDAPLLRWGRWVDDEHVIAVVDQTLVLWNIVSGEMLYRIDGIDDRAQPAISGGRRWVAVPYEGEVQLIATATGLSRGRISVEKQVPSVCFSPTGDQLAIATSRHLRVWDLTSPVLASDIKSQNLGNDPPAWVGSDLILSSSGVLSSVSRQLPVWRYDLAATESVAIGNHVAIFRKYPTPELSVAMFPHAGARQALRLFDQSPTATERQNWRILGRSTWKAGTWDDRDLQISTAPAPTKR